MGCLGAEVKEPTFAKRKEKDEFINNFFENNKKTNVEEDKRSGLFIKNQKKKMIISNEIIRIEQELIISFKSDNPDKYNDSKWVFLDEKSDKIKSKKIYVDDVLVDDTKFEIHDYSINISFEKIFNGQSRKIKIIEEFENTCLNYGDACLTLNSETPTQCLIVTEDDIKIDYITKKNYILNKELNLAYYEGISSADVSSLLAYVFFTKKINYKIYQYIPEFRKAEKNIIEIMKKEKDMIVADLAIYEKIDMTEEGQNVEVINKIMICNLAEGRVAPTITFSLIQDNKYIFDFVELNGRKVDYFVDKHILNVKNVQISVEQCGEFHFKYRCISNVDKLLTRVESIYLTKQVNYYGKIIVDIPEKYDIIEYGEKFKKDPKKINSFYFNGIISESMNKSFKICYKKAVWEYEREYIIEPEENVKESILKIHRSFKGGNLKILEYNIEHENFEFTDDEKENKFIFTIKNPNSKNYKIKFKLKFENSTGGYNGPEKKDALTKIPDEDIQFFKDLSNKIISEDKSELPIYQKLGNWVYGYLKYDLKYFGINMTAKEIYNKKEGICVHFTLLYNALLKSQGIESAYIRGIQLKITEDNILKENEEYLQQYKKDGNFNNLGHAWTLAEINGKWIPLDATWKLFGENFPITHIFENFLNGSEIRSGIKNLIEKEKIKYIKN